MRIAICDDQEEFLVHVKTCLSQWNNGRESLQISTFTDGDSLIRAHSSAPFDVIFLDVVMPLLNGIDTAWEIRQLDKVVQIVFLTSSAEYALDSYRVKASNYLLKPIKQETLFRCMDEIVQTLWPKIRSIAIKTAGSIHRVDVNNIEYLEAQNKHVLFALADGRTLTSIDPLYAFEKKLTLEDGFFKCNRSYIVNMYRIDAYSQKEIRMRSGARIPISRSCQREFEDAYFTAIFGKAGEL